MNYLNNPLYQTESLINSYENQTLGFDPSKRQLKTKWIPTSAEEQTAIVAHVKEVFKHLTSLKVLEDWERDAKCVRMHRFVNGLARVESAHENTLSNYQILYSGVHQFLDNARKEVDAQVLLSYCPGALIHADQRGHLHLELPREYSEHPLTLIDQKEEQQIVDRLIGVINAEVYRSERQGQMLEKLEQVQSTARSLGYKILESKVQEFLAQYQRKQWLEEQAAKLLSDIQSRQATLAMQPSHAFESPDYYQAGQEIARCLEALQSLSFPELQLTVVKGLQEKLAQAQKQLAAQHAAQALSQALSRAQALKTQATPFQQFKDSFQTLIGYTPTYSKLAVDKGALYYPKVQFAFDAKSVQECIRLRVEAFIKAFGNPAFHKGDLIRAGEELSKGLEAIIKDYGSHKEFSAGISALQIVLKHTLKEQANGLDHQVHELALNPKATIYQFLDIQANQYPVELMIKAFAAQYGSDLTDHLFKVYIPKGQAVISREEVRDLLFAAAADVKQSDLKWKYHHSPLNTGKPFEKLSETEYVQVLNTFRKAPNGLNLLKYFHIPLTWDKHNVADEFLKTLPENTVEACNRKNALQVVADIESSHMWHGRRAVRMSPALMYDNLAKILQNPCKADLFHSDYYLSYLAFASTCFALLQDCQGDARLLQARVPVLLARIEQILQNPPKEYPKQHLHRYLQKWQMLHAKLKYALENPAADLSAPFTEFLVHPAANNKDQTIDLHGRVRSTEYLARKVAYWNKYFLENPAVFQNVSPQRVNQPIRTGTLFHLQEGAEVVLYEVRQCSVQGGLVCQVCMPVNTHRYRQKGSPIPIKVLFQGTIIQSASYGRDFAITKPGHQEWQANGFGNFCSALGSVITSELHKHDNQAQFHIELTGHSLGGSDTQNGAAELGHALLTGQIPPDLIDKVRVVTFNPAGVPQTTVEKFNVAFEKLHDKLEAIIHAVVKDDVVEVSGEYHLGANLKVSDRCFLLEKSSTKGNGEMDLHCDLAHANTATNSGTIYPIRLLNPAHPADSEQIHRYLNSFAASTGAFANHLTTIVARNPVVKGVLATTSGVTLIAAGFAASAVADERPKSKKSGDRESKEASEGGSLGATLMVAGLATATTGIANATSQYVKGTQILEGVD